MRLSGLRVLSFLFIFLALQNCSKTPITLHPSPFTECDLFQPSPMIPNTNCVNHCQYVYQGTVNFNTQELYINCQLKNCITVNWSWTIDSTTVRHIDEGYIKAFKIQTPNFSAWCKRDLLFQSPDCNSNIELVQTTASPKAGTILILMAPEFWECYEGGDMEFRFTARLQWEPVIGEG